MTLTATTPIKECELTDTKGTVIRIGTRGSDLALAQVVLAKAALAAANVDATVEVEIITTTGDRSALRDAPMDQGKGDFVKEIESALLDRRVDVAVHSMKDLPVALPNDLELVACLTRANPRDVLISREGWSLDDLSHGARVGTSSPRRKAMLLRARPDLEVAPIRGNVPTRLRKTLDGDYDATVLARAGLDRLTLHGFGATELDESIMLPAPCQGIIGIETRAGELINVWRAIDHTPSHVVALCERAVVRDLGADCHTPLGVFAQLTNDNLQVEARLLTPDGAEEERHMLSGGVEEAEEIGTRLAAMFEHRP